MLYMLYERENFYQSEKSMHVTFNIVVPHRRHSRGVRLSEGLPAGAEGATGHLRTVEGLCRSRR